MFAQEVFKKGWLPTFQGQVAPGLQCKLDPPPVEDITADGNPYKHAGKLQGKSAIITGGDSGRDAKDVEELIKKKALKCKVLFCVSDLRSEQACRIVVKKHVEFHSSGKVDVLVCNHGNQKGVKSLLDLTSEQWEDTFKTNIHSFLYLSKAAIPSMLPDSSIIYTTFITPFVGHPELVDYTATKGAILGLMRSLSNQIVGDKQIRVNAVAPGPIWTPLMYVQWFQSA
ncbi:hypothetical protein Clacol_007732 [Clathrus columnatus]|uniref:Uncharacterized protein n=1 Tax=Clathrus columnatus TaxID=1419009 RepID=A0AAV5AK61_9AGAM|nr:hypothetical protein Clacol_007732 [Clathrus columnatus]